MNDKKWKNYNPKRISVNVKKVLETGDIEHLEKTSYDFLMMMDGFIAHYDLNGFKSYYTNTEFLRSNILASMDTTSKDRYISDRYFSQGDQAEYYRSKYDALIELEKVCQRAETKSKSIKEEKDEDLFELIKELVKRSETDKELKEQLLIKFRG